MTGLIPRRALLLGAGVTGTGFVLGACTGSRKPRALVYAGEFREIALAAALENQAAGFYRALLGAMRAGKLSEPAPAVASLAAACLKQHSEHAATWNAILRSARQPIISGTPLASHPAVMSGLRSASTVSAAAALACRLEDEAAQTYVAAAGSLTSAAGVAAAAAIAPVEAMHAAALRFILGEEPVPASFTGIAMAFHNSDLILAQP